MDVSCPACAAKYTCDEEKLRGKTARMRCKACNTAWMVSGPGASSAPKTPGSMGSSMPPRPDSMMPRSADSSGEAKRAAVVRKGADREKRDLFAIRAPEEGSIKEVPSQVKDTLLPPPNFGFTTGSRNENSVLFRVDQLANNVGGRIKTPEPEYAPQHVAKASEPPARGDEEGVIDLKALASVPPPGKRSVIPVAPLFSEPPPMTVDAFGTGSRPSIPHQKPISKGKLFGAIAAAAAFLVIAGAGLSFAFKGEEPVHRAAAVAPPPAPSPIVSAAPPPAADPPPAASTASSEDTDGAKKTKKGKKRKAGNASASNQPKAPPKPADPCGCHGDFNCIMACTVKNGH
jgi:predicted Zn finger-like uncharacterized protein